VTTQFFTLFDALTTRSLPIDDPERVVHVSTRDGRARPGGVSYADFEDLRDAATSFAALAAYEATPAAIAGDDRAPARLQRVFISAGGLGLLGETPVLGRDFRAGDGQRGAPAVVVLAGHVWRDRYGGDRAVVGRTIRIDGEPAEVIGVMPEGFRFPRLADLWQPVSQVADLAEQPRDQRAFGVIGRLADGASVAGTRAEVDTIAATLARDHPEAYDDVRHVTVPVAEQFVSSDPTHPAWFAFLSAGVVVLLIACANAANLMLIQAVRRRREIAVRLALGASRWRVVRQVLIECAVLAFLGVLVGGSLAMLGLRALENAIPDGVLGYWITFDFDTRVFAAMVGIGVASVFLFGLVPALSVSNRAGGTLRVDARTAAGPSTGRLAGIFLAAEFGLTLILLTAISNSMLRFVEERRTFTTPDSEGVLTAEVALTTDRYATPEARTAFFEDVRVRLGARNTTAAIADALPGGGPGGTTGIRIDERPAAPAELLPTALTLTTGPGYFDAIGAPLLRGRPFSDRDGAPGSEAAIVNARFVEIHFPGEEPVGRRIGLVTAGADGPASWLTIVGVAPTLQQRPARREPDPLVYLPSRTDPPRVATLLVRAPADPGSAASVVRETVRRIDPDLPLFRVRTLEQALRDISWNGRLSEAILWTIAFIALVLSTAGLFAVTSHAVERQMHDLGIRIALGARPPQVGWMVLRNVVRHLTLGTAVGAVGVYVWSTWIEAGNGAGGGGLLVSLLLFAPGPAVVTLVGLMASLGPVRRAVRLDPVKVLRQE
ncbi:MAG: ABC transporter permease, partial [Acidobacteria bacterium]|nr:ABC transporter permease [Acidobacteriota bacterium]